MIIPQPKNLVNKSGRFIIDENTALCANDILTELAIDFKHYVLQHYNVCLTTTSKEPIDNNISFEITNDFISEEEYTLSVSEHNIVTRANSVCGIFYAIQTLKQLILCDNGTLYIPSQEIEDAPQYSWRGFMLDESRHFFGKEFVKKILDIMSFYKLNRFHWHLTDDQGWRIQIKKYPQLTNIGGYRLENGSKYGGFYTQKDVREIVHYAEKRNITIIPEIDIPGHFSAAIASYPYLGCKTETLVVPSRYGILRNIACAGKNSTYQFTYDVLDDICSLFPSNYIHIGGDEVPKHNWKACDACQQKIHEESLQNETQLQGYFTNLITEYLNKKGKEVIVWNDILNADNLNNNVIIHHWLDGLSRKHTVQSINAGKKTIMSDMFSLYFDYPNEVTTLKKVYKFNPVFQRVNRSENILGVQGNLWSEMVESTAKAEYMVFPRLLALSENAWSSIPKSYQDFITRVKRHYFFLDQQNINAFPYSRLHPNFFKKIKCLIKHVYHMTKGTR